MTRGLTVNALTYRSTQWIFQVCACKKSFVWVESFDVLHRGSSLIVFISYIVDSWATHILVYSRASRLLIRRPSDNVALLKLPIIKALVPKSKCRCYCSDIATDYYDFKSILGNKYTAVSGDSSTDWVSIGSREELCQCNHLHIKLSRPIASLRR